MFILEASSSSCLLMARDPFWQGSNWAGSR